MTNISNTSANNQDYEVNLKLSYEYLEKSIKEVQDVINNTNTQFGILIGFNFTFIRFFINDLPIKIVLNQGLDCNSCLLFKILAYGFSFVSIIFSFIGLYQTTELKIIKPEVLIENCDRVPNWELQLAIMERFEAKLEDFRKLALQKKQIFNSSIIMFIISGLMAIFDEIIATIFS